MSVAYKSIQWNQQKVIYDLLLAGTLALYVFLFVSTAEWFGGPDIENGLRGVWIRAYGSAAFLLLHVILSIGPLTRLSPKFYPLLFNRRHMGVVMFGLGLHHARRAMMWYHDAGNLDPIVSLLTGNTNFGFIPFPFELLGVIALLILGLMAFTSHDFWLHNLTAPIWKALHMGVYIAYALLVGHVLLGALQTNKHPVLTISVAIGLVWILGVHFWAARKEAARDHETYPLDADGFADIGSITEIPEDQAKVVTLSGERIAVFKYDGKISAISNVCQHQNGPLGEGKIMDGCITCPWHGYQYRPEDGCSPPPFTEKVPTFTVKLQGDRILLRAIPNPAGTPVPPAVYAEQTV
ncbi:MAG: Rieske 2Fe-2S domain-containing protein [Spirulinaceae cyanobacterium]